MKPSAVTLECRSGFASRFKTTPAMNTRAKDKLIVALDFDSPRRALELFDALREVVGMFKIG